MTVEIFYQHTVLVNVQFMQPVERGFIRIPNYARDTPLIETQAWCAGNCSSHYFNDGMRFYFESARDATLFKVRYG